MSKVLYILSLVLILSGCSKREYYYVSNSPDKLYQTPSDESLAMAEIKAGDTLISRSRLGKPKNHFVRIRHNAGSGYVRYNTQKYLFSALYNSPSRPNTNYSSSSSGLDLSKPVHVRSHTRRTKSGKTVQVRAHTRSRPGSGSTSRSYRSSGYRSSGSGYRSSGSRGGRH